ncbi:MAG: anhydro-N-acetylmuramic acid kinase [Saprospiraceae bacterium]|nr:anhydro-N-acetylmuramic acid kinase [Saprospiraceae bacterium]
MTTYQILGLMSGSSLDGLDLANCQFSISEDNQILSWDILQAETLPYSTVWQERLRQLPMAAALELARTDVAYGALLGKMARTFIQKHNLQPDYIASHGHTIFHYPEQKLSLQIGDGAAIAAATGYPVICDFRTQDIALGGQGAPLAPTADQYLFTAFQCCLNLGGIANISVQTPRGYVAFDICGANQILNALVKPIGLEYDDKGKLAAGGQLIPELFQQSLSLAFFQEDYPKSLGNDWVMDHQTTAFCQYDAHVADKLHTATLMIAKLIADHLERVIEREGLTAEGLKMMITGGGAFNDFLVECIQAACGSGIEICIPSDKVIGFKEAALMALMGLLRIRQVPNCLASVTGASQDSINGALHQIAELTPTYPN